MTDLKREDVARVLAELHVTDVCHGLSYGQVRLRRNLMLLVALRLDLRPEFESALKALEKEQGRG